MLQYGQERLQEADAGAICHSTPLVHYYRMSVIFRAANQPNQAMTGVQLSCYVKRTSDFVAASSWLRCTAYAVKPP